MKINGKLKVLPQNTILLEYLTQNGYQLDRIAVEYNDIILTQEQYAMTVLQENDTIEIVSFVGGG